MKKIVAVLMMLFLAPAFAHYEEPSPAPVPPIEHKHGTNVVNVAVIVAIVATVGTWLYCHLTNKC